MAQIVNSSNQEYWKERLRDLSPCHFPILNDGIQPSSHQRQECRVAAPQIEELRKFCSNYELNLSTVFLAAWALVLRIYTSRDDVILGYQEAEHNTVPFHIRLSRESSLIRVLNSIETSYARDKAHHTFKKSEIDSISRLAGEALFNTQIRHRVSISLSNEHDTTTSRLQILHHAPTSEPCPIVLDILSDLARDSLAITLTFCPTHLSAGQAKNVASSLEKALICVLTGAHLTVGEQLLFSGYHRSEIERWNSGRPESQNTTIHEAISMTVRRQPEEQAIDAWDERLTYAEMDQFATVLAQHLIYLGLKSGSMIPLVFERSAWWAVSLLAVSKAGGVFVPIDVLQPALRLREILDDINPEFLLSSAECSRLLSDRVKTTVVVTRSNLERLFQGRDKLPTLPNVDPASVAYAMYTSGSSGKPKGAMMPHGGYLTALLYWAADTNLGPGQRVLQISSYAWTICIIETVVALWHGACLCVPSQYSKQNDLTNVFNEMRITWAFLSPSICKTIQRESVQHLQSLILAGEPVTKELISSWLSEKTKVWCGWGATECVMLARPDAFTTSSNVQNLGRCKGICRIVEIGNPEREVPIGAVGEIIVHTPWTVHGYLNDPERTATSFLDRPDWLQGGPSKYGSRWFRVGDLVRQNSDGGLVLAGRGDNMVKIRGQRFDMADVERNLAQDQEIRNSLPLVPSKGICKQRLVAVISLKRLCTNENDASEKLELLQGSELENAASWVSTFREALAGRVPSYMVPTVWIMVKKFPLTITGKVDRMFLKRFVEDMGAEMFEEISSVGVAYEAPVSPSEHYLQKVWADTLDIPFNRVGRNTPFISLGGDSILAMSVAGQCIKEGLRVRTQDILKYGTIAKLIAKIEPKADERTAEAIKLASQYKELHPKIKERLLHLFPSIDNIEDAYPASPMQTGMLLSKAKMTGNYNTSTIYEVRPTVSSRPVDIHLLQQAWQKVVSRHSVLRTYFVENVSQGGSFDQVVLRNYDVSSTTTIWKDIDAQSHSDVVKYFDKEECNSYPVYRPPHNFAILQTVQGRIFCRLNAEHTLVDGMSVAIIVRDLRQAYDNPLPKYSLSMYGMYITSLQEVVCRVDNNYWKSYLEGMHPCILPTLSYSLSREPPQVESRSIEVNIRNSRHLLLFCQSQGITLSALFRTIWGIVLRSYTGSDEVCFGYITSGRDLPLDGIEEIVGTFINMLVCRMQFSRDKLVKDIVEKANVDYLNSLSHQHASLAQIQHLLGLSGQRLFNTSMTVLKQVPLDCSQDPSIVFDVIHEWSPNEYDIDVQVWVSKEDVTMELWYRSEALSDNHAHNIASTFSKAIDTITDDFDQRIGQLDLFSEHHRDQVRSWNSKCPESIDICLHDQVTAQAIIRPDAIAITSCNRDFTYTQLEKYSDRLAHYLVSIGIGLEIHVLLCFEKSAFAIVAMLSVLKAGGVCVSIDPTHPVQRLQRIIADTRPRSCLISKIHRRLFDTEGLHGVVEHVITVDGLRFESDFPPANNSIKPCPNVTANNAAFVLFTSGSTGTPKGIVHEHRTVASSLHHHGLAMGIDATSRTIQFSAFVFDVSITEIFMALTRGGVLCIPSDEERMNNLALAITRMSANWAHLTPTVASLLDPKTVPTLKHMALAGEPLKRTNITDWAPSLQLVNLYGPAECCLATTLRVGLMTEDRPDNIGKAVGLLVWIVDPANTDQLVPVGAVGELLLEGPNVAREYLRDRERTLSSFIENPAWLFDDKTIPARRFYRSGDLARYNGDGSIQILGRIDTQVKIHGQRVEIGEIEYQIKVNLAPHNLVNMAVVYANSNQLGGGTLAAFVQFDEKSENFDGDQLMLSISTHLKNILVSLDSYLAEVLPAYMVPSLYIPLNLMPLLTAGKIDRAKLVRILERLPSEVTAIYSLSEYLVDKVQPRTRMERLLQMLWSRVLNVDIQNIGVDDNFFRIGGDSVAAMKVSAAGREVGTTITVANIFQNPKLSSLALAAKTFNEKLLGLLTSAHGISKESVVDIYPATPLQEGMMLETSKNPKAYMMQKVWDFTSGFRTEQLKLAWDFLYKEIPILRTRIIDTGQSLGAMQVVLNDIISWHTHSSLEEYLAMDRDIAMNYGSALCRFAIIRGEQNSMHFILTAHHAIIDKHSLDQLLVMTKRLYLSISTHAQPSIPSQLAPFKDFALDVFNMNVLAAEAFWQKQFSNMLFSHFPQRGAGHQALATSLLNQYTTVPESNGSGFSTMIRAAWALLLSQYTDSQESIVFGMVLDGRQNLHLTRNVLIGPALATVPIITSFDSQLTVDAFLKEVEQHTREVQNFQHFGLRNIKGLDADASRACDFQTLIAVHPFRDGHEESFLGKSVDYEDPPKCLLQIEHQPETTGLHTKVQYDPYAISTLQMQRLLNQFEHVLHQLSHATRTMKIHEVEFCSPQDVQDISLWNRNLPPRANNLVHDVIFNHDPQLSAVCSWDGNIKYSQLDELSSKLARHLRAEFDVGPEFLVPLAFTKSKWAVVAMMAVLKAGGAYVPMDASQPIGRLRQIVDACKASLILCSPQHENLARALARRVMIVSQKSMDRLDYCTEVGKITLNPQNACYVIFTSGSTGVPKGVVMEHGAFSTAAIEHGKRLCLNAQSRVIHFSSYSFEACILEILTTLYNGGCVCIAPESERLEDIAKAMTDMQVNWAFFTPSFIRTIRPDQVPDLRTLVLGGEALGADNIDIWADKMNLVNGYGPSETCIFSITHENVHRKHTPDLIGRPIGGACWIADPNDHTKLVPVGAVGELLIEGNTLARGYLNNAEKTSEAFIDNSKLQLSTFVQNGHAVEATLPQLINGHKTAVTNGSQSTHKSLSEAPRRRLMYKTGDLVRYSTEISTKGKIHFVGRKDSQVKVRGQRLELGEIEYHLKSRLQFVSHIAVEYVKLPTRESQYLAAFFSLANQNIELDSSPSSSLPISMTVMLKNSLLITENALQDILPSYMIPALYVPLRRVPLLPSGKTNRKALHHIALELTSLQVSQYTLSADEKRYPKSEREIMLSKLWANILQLEDRKSVGLDDSFFRLGGDSIAAMKLTTLARVHHVLLNVSTVFQHPRLEDMAQATLVLKDRSDPDLKPFALLPSDADRKLILNQISHHHGISSAIIEDIYPAGPLQEGLMLLSIKQPGSYISQITLSLHGNVDINRFKMAWQKTIERNSILRTRFVHTGRQLFQLVLADNIAWAHPKDLKAYLAKDKATQMKLGDPLVRYALIDSGNGFRTFVLTTHHSLYDGWSLMLIMEDFEMMYKGNNLKAAAPPYVEFIKYLATINLTIAEKFWKSQFDGKYLASYPEPRNASQAPVETQISQFTSIQRPKGSDITLSTIIRAAWALLVARYADTKDVFFGVTLMGRNSSLPNIERMTGPTITTLPICISINDSESINDYLQRVQDQGIKMMPFEHTGLQNIKAFSQEARRACDFQNLLVIQPEGSEDLKSEVWKERVLFAKGEMVTMTYALIIECRLYPDKIRITAQYREHIISTIQMQRMVEQFAYTMHQLNNISQSDEMVSNVQLISKKDEREVVGWNSTAPSNTPIDDCIHNIIKEKSMEQPSSPAVESWDGKLTYAKLDNMSNRLAHYLISLGVKSGSYIPICFDKSAWTIVAMLSVLKTGAAYVSLDPRHPQWRKDHIIGDVQATFILSESQYGSDFQSKNLNVVVIDEGCIQKLEVVPGLRIRTVSSRNAAFVVFTSGSTGQPKGIVMEHGAFISSARAHSQALRISPQSRVMQFAAYTYDVSMGEILTTLMQGGCVCVPSDEERMGNLAAAVNKLKVNWMFLTPTVASFLHPHEVPRLETLVLGGEHATKENFRTWADHLCLINSYANLGTPVGSALWIVDVDNSNTLAPVGAIGELLVEGPTLAREYLNDPEKTNAAFIDNPAWAITSSESKRRMYRTGDLVRYGPSGNLVFVGRRDTQIKIHGQRIELGEIEQRIVALSPLNWLPVVDLLRFADVKRDVTLCAFVQMKEAYTELNTEDILPLTNVLREKFYTLRSELEQLLPSHMVPALYIPFQRLPLTAGGKVDRVRLKILGESFNETDILPYLIDTKTLCLPSTDNERKLQGLWATVLSIPRDTIGANSNFLRIGGDSVAAMKLSAAAREIGWSLTIKNIFRSPKLDDMARAIEVESNGDTDNPYAAFSTLQNSVELNAEQLKLLVSTPGPCTVENIEDILPATDYQRWTLGCGQLKTRGYNNWFIFHFEGNLDTDRLQNACQKLIDRHPVLRTIFVAHKFNLYQVVLKHSVPEYTLHSHVGSGVPMYIIKKDMERPVVLSESSVRFLLMDQGEDGFRLMMRASHALYDGVSLPYIVRDLKAAYLGESMTENTPYHQFISHTLQSSKVQDGEKFWREELKGSMMTNVIAHQEPTYAHVVNKSLKRILPALSLKNGITFATIIKAAWSLVLAKFSGTSDIVFGQITTGRSAPIRGIDGIIGACMNLVPVRVDLSATTTHLELLQQVQNRHLDMLPFESLGFQHIIDKCTSWPKWTRFSSILQHTTFNVGMGDTEQWDEAEMKLESFSPEHDVSDIWIWTGPSRGGYYLDFTYSEETLPESLALQMTDLLCEYVKTISENPAAVIGVGSPSAEPVIPIKFDDPQRSKSDPSEVHLKSPMIGNIKKAVLQVWAKVFGNATGNLPDNTTERSPFYEIRGDLLAAAQISTAFAEQGYQISPEEVISNATIYLQTIILSQRVQKPSKEESTCHGGGVNSI